MTTPQAQTGRRGNGLESGLRSAIVPNRQCTDFFSRAQPKRAMSAEIAKIADDRRES